MSSPEIDALAAAAAAADLIDVAPVPGAAAPAPTETAASWADFVVQMAHLVLAVRPDLGKPDKTGAVAWSQDNLKAFGAALGRCMDFYGVGDVSKFINHPLLALGFAGWPLAAPFLLPFIESRLSALKGKPPASSSSAPAPAPAPAEGAADGVPLKTVEDGAP